MAIVPGSLDETSEFMRKHPEWMWSVDRRRFSRVVGSHWAGGLPRSRHQEICGKPTSFPDRAIPRYWAKWIFFRRYCYRPETLLCEDQRFVAAFIPLPVVLRICPTSLWMCEEHFICERFLSLATPTAKFSFDAFSQRDASIGHPRVGQRAAKMLLDWVAVSTGLNYRLLRHRAQPITAEERGVA